jgi:nitronate monooxygenase
VTLELPIIQAPIGSASTPALVAAVCNSGGLGMLSGTWRPPDELRELIQQTKSLTNQPFGVNLVLAWDMTERLDICLSEGVEFLSFFWGEPPSEFIRKCHKNGARVFHTVGSAREAKIAVDRGVDFVVAQGVEAGGHVWGSIGTMALVPAVVDAVPKTPVIAAGGIGDARGVRAALALGARAAWCGTRFLLAEEAAVHPRYREKLIAASETDTRHTTCFSGGWPDAPHRALVNETLLAWERGERQSDIIAHYADGEPIERYSSNLPGPGVVGEIDEMCLYAGQSAWLLKRTQPASEIVAELSHFD